MQSFDKPAYGRGRWKTVTVHRCSSSKKTQPKVAGFSELMGLRWQERTGLVANSGDVQVLGPVSCFSFFQSETNEDTNKRTGQGAHIKDKDKSSNCQGKD